MKIRNLALFIVVALLASSCGATKGSTPSNQPGTGGNTDPGTGGGTGGNNEPTKVTVNAHTLSDSNPPIDINSIGQNVNKSTWNSFKHASASMFTNHYNYTYRYFVGGQVTYESFTKNGYELSNNTGTYYYERINNELYTYSRVSDGLKRIPSSYDFIAHRSEVLANEVYTHMFDYENYTYYGEDDGLDGVFLYNTTAFSTEVKFQGGYLTHLRYTLNSPMSTYEIQLAFETTIDIPKSYYMK